MRESAIQHLTGITGQVAAVLPVLSITIYLSREFGLETAGLFTVLVGASAAAYSTALWGLRTTILLDRFRSYSHFDFLGARILGLSLAAIVICVAGIWLDMGAGIVAGMVILRVCDGLIDLSFAMMQVRCEGGEPIQWFTRQHLEKLLIFLAGLGVAAFVRDDAFYAIFVVCGAISLLLVILRLASEIAYSEGERIVSAPKIRAVLAGATWFAVAAAVCAVLTSVPRISLAWLYSGEQLGVIGVSLSVSTFFGMVFYTTWIRYLPRFKDGTRTSTVAGGFILENVVLAVACLLGSWFILPSVVAFVFDLSTGQDIEQSRNILVASVIFFAGMNVCNLYKVSGVVWMETVAYAVALIAFVLAALTVTAMQRTEFLMTLAGMVMLAIGLMSFYAPRRVNEREGPE